MDGSIFDKWRNRETNADDLRLKAPQARPEPPQARPVKSCVHDGQSPSFTLTRARKPGSRGPRGQWQQGGSDTIHVYGARGSSLNAGASLSHLDLLIDMSGSVKPKAFAKRGSWGGRELNAVAFPQVLSLDWPDMTAPTWVGARFWLKLLSLLPSHVCISCVGSHGRTGTAMACLMVANGMSPERAIATVREKHCKHAIETQGQQAYIHAMAKQIETLKP